MVSISVRRLESQVYVPGRKDCMSYGSSPKKSVFACDDCASLLDKLSSEMLFFCFMCCVGLYVGLRAVRDFFLPTFALAWTFK